MKEKEFVKEVNTTRQIPCWSDFGEIFYKNLSPHEEFLCTDSADGGWIRCNLHNEVYTYDASCPKCHPVAHMIDAIAFYLFIAILIGFPLWAILTEH